MIPGAFCSGCVFFAPNQHNLARGGGQCRRHAPLLDRADDRVRTIWPLVWDDHWCGEHSTVDTGE